MNKAITDGIIFNPTPFGDGLDVWSSEDGTPGSNVYQGASNASLIASDSDFGTCLELLKTQNIQKLRYMGETPMAPGCYLQIKIRLKAISGPLPSVRVAAWAGGAGGSHVGGVDETGASLALTTYGKVETIAVVVGSGARTGVDMVWGRTPIYGHFGLDMTGPNGGVVRIEDIEITDVTSVFHRDMLDIVDVTDFGAVGDGTTDCRNAFEAADAAAAGRTVYVPEGTYLLAGTVTMNSQIKFDGTVTMPTEAIFSLTQNFKFTDYVEAFGSEELAFKKAFQALLNFSDHESLDLEGRRISVTEPIDLQAAVANRTSFATRRVIRNGLLDAKESAAWDTDTVSASANYAASSPTKLKNVSNVATIQVGSLVVGSGVAEETYVNAVNVAANEITLSNPLWGAPSSQTYTFKRFKYILDFSGFNNMQRFNIEGLDFLCNGRSSALMMPRDGLMFQVRGSYFTKPKDRGITSIGGACAGMQIDGCQFLSNEQAVIVPLRTSIAFNINSNDTKIRHNRSVRFKHFAVMKGGGHMFIGNHFFQGDDEPAGQTTAGIILSNSNVKTTIANNYVDNCFIEWGNAADPTPDNTGGFSFGGLTISANIFTANDVASWFSWLQIKPYGEDHYINGLNISGNVFKHLNGGNIERVDKVNTTHADLDHSRHRNLMVQGNTFNSVTKRMQNPVTVDVSSSSPDDTWVTDLQDYLPFGAQAKLAVSCMANNPIRNANNVRQYTTPYAVMAQGANKSQAQLVWQQPVKGKVELTVRCDNPE